LKSHGNAERKYNRYTDREEGDDEDEDNKDKENQKLREERNQLMEICNELKFALVKVFQLSSCYLFCSGLFFVGHTISFSRE
jgi:hypothetical protein